MTRKQHGDGDGVKLFVVLLAGAAFIIMTSLSASAHPHPGNALGVNSPGIAHTHSGKRVSQLFNRLDVNKDGMLSKAEMTTLPARKQNRLARADANNDGFVTKTELTTFKKFNKNRRGNKRARRHCRGG